MSDAKPQVLSTEEVDAILQVTKDKDKKPQPIGDVDAPPLPPDAILQSSSFKNITDMISIVYEKHLVSFLRKKFTVKFKSGTYSTLGEALQLESEKPVFSVFRITPDNQQGIFTVGLSFLHQTMNLLFGGKIDPTETIIEKPGKVGLIVAEKIANLSLTALIQGCAEYATLNFEIVKTSALPSVSSSLVMEDNVFILDFHVEFEEMQSTMRFMIAEGLIQLLVAPKSNDARHREKDFWRTAIQSQVIDSMVTLSVNLPDVSVKANEFMELKEGDLLPISDPTLVYVCLNNLKLFRAKAGQANNKRVVKILKQI